MPPSYHLTNGNAEKMTKMQSRLKTYIYVHTYQAC
jgi:hypothetical protein